MDDRRRLEQIDRARSQPDEGVPMLLDLLVDPSWTVRRRVVAALAAAGDKAVAPLCQLLCDSRSDETRIAAVVDTLSTSVGESVANEVIALGAHEDPAVRADVAQILGRRRARAGLPLLSRLATGVEDNVAVGAIEALGRIGGRAAVDALVAAVNSGNFFRTFPAIDVLGRSGDPRAVLPLAGLLEDSRYSLEAMRALSQTGDRQAVAPLTAMLSKKNGLTVRVAAVALSDLRQRFVELYAAKDAVDESLRQTVAGAGVRSLLQALGSARAEEQKAICTLLGILRDPDAVGPLSQLLDGPPPVSQAAAEALHEMGRSATEQLLLILQDGESAKRAAILPLVSNRTGAADAVVRCLEDPDGNVRALAAGALARIGKSDYVGTLFPLLGDPNPRVVQAAVGAIQSLGSSATEGLTIAAANASDVRVRREAFRIAGYFGYRSALPALLRALDGDDDRLRDAALHALPLIEDPSAVRALLERAVDPAPRTRASALRALGKAETAPANVAVVRAALRDEDAWVRYYAAQALGKLGVTDAVSDLRTLLDDAAGQVRVSAVEALSNLASEEALTVLLDASASSELDLRRAALLGLGLRKGPAAVRRLLDALGSEDAATRLVSTSALASFEGPEVTAALGRAASDRDENVATTALGLLAARSSDDATDALIAVVERGERRDRALLALSAACPGRIHGIVRALDRADEELAGVLTSALARVRTAEAADALRRVLQSANPVARRAAVTTLFAAYPTPETLDALEVLARTDADDDLRRLAASILAR